MSLCTDVLAAIGPHEAVRTIELAGSRAEGRATAFSDWDFVVATDDFPALARDLPDLCAPLAPLALQWDPLSPHQCWMLMLPGPTKVDLIFPDEPHPEALVSYLKGDDCHARGWHRISSTTELTDDRQKRKSPADHGCHSRPSSTPS